MSRQQFHRRTVQRTAEPRTHRQYAALFESARRDVIGDVRRHISFESRDIRLVAGLHETVL
jgi:hypothetical protein